ncbi:MAG: glycosyltransferase [Actinomycetota bacterium]
MRILYFADASSVHTVRWTGFFAAGGHDVHIASWQPPSRAESGVTYHDLRAFAGSAVLGRVPKLRAIEWLPRMRRAARQLSLQVAPELVHGHYVRGYGHLALLSGRQPLMVTAWGLDLYGYRSQGPMSRLLTRRTLARADLTTCDSVDLANVAVTLGAPLSRVRVIQFGVDTALFRPGRSTTDLRRDLDLAPSDPVVLSPRSIGPGYCTDSVVRAFSEIRAGFPAAKLVLMDYPSEQSDTRSVRELIEELRLQDSVRFSGQRPYSDLPEFYCLADAVVSLKATPDSSPVSVLEAMACGRPVVASDHPGVREWIRPGENGYLADPADPQAIASQLGAALSLDEGTVTAWGLRNRRDIERRADHDRNMAEVERLYDDLVGNDLRASR